MRNDPSLLAIAPVMRAPSFVRTATEARAMGALASASMTLPAISPGAGGGPAAPGPAGPCAPSEAALNRIAPKRADSVRFIMELGWKMWFAYTCGRSRCALDVNLTPKLAVSFSAVRPRFVRVALV